MVAGKAKKIGGGEFASVVAAAIVRLVHRPPESGFQRAFVTQAGETTEALDLHFLQSFHQGSRQEFEGHYSASFFTATLYLSMK